METIYRQITPRKLTKSQLEAKIAKDSEYEIAVQNLSAEFYRKKRTTGVSSAEEANYKKQKARLWQDYMDWAMASGLYEEVTPDQQLTEAEVTLSTQLERVNQIRSELNRYPLGVKEITKIRAV